MSEMLAFSSEMVYYLYMASIIGKKQNGKTYYYLVESARVKGKPRIVSQQYLGPAEEILARLGDGSSEPTSTRHRSFGDITGVWSVLEKLDVIGIIDDVVGSNKEGSTVSVGTYMALATLNRVVAPCSKLAFSDWWQKCAGDRLVKLPIKAQDHRRFWDAMNSVSDTDLVEIQRRITKKVIETFNVDIKGLVLDMTNFATYIDSANTKAPIAKRGRAKQKRYDLRLVGLGLIVTLDSAIPVVSYPYAGNNPDVTQFPLMIKELISSFKTLEGEPNDLTVVFDAGQDSEANLELLRDYGLYFVGSIPPSQHPKLLEIPLESYKVIDEDLFPGVTAIESKTQAFGSTYRVVVTHSNNFHIKQARSFNQTLAKATRLLNDLEQRLSRGKTRKSKSALDQEIAAILKPRWVGRIITWKISGSTPKDFRLSFEVDKEAREILEKEIFGKRILFTNRDDWQIPDIIGAYRSQHKVESDFRQMKDTSVVSFSPMFHFTDQKIRVHVFYCVLALTIARIMTREAAKIGYPMSVTRLLSNLGEIQETVLLYKGDRGRPRARHVLTEMDPIQEILYKLFELDFYAPKR